MLVTILSAQRDIFFCPTSNRKPKYAYFTLMNDKVEQQVLTLKKKKKMEPADVWDFCLQNDFTQSGWKLIFFPLTNPLNVAAVDARVDANSHLAVRSLYSVGWHLKCALDEESFRNATYFESEKYIQRCD